VSYRKNLVQCVLITRQILDSIIIINKHESLFVKMQKYIVLVKICTDAELFFFNSVSDVLAV